MRLVRAHRNHHRQPRRIGPQALRHSGKAPREILDHDHTVTAHRLGQWPGTPGCRVVERYGERGRRIARIYAGGAGKARASAIGIDQVKQSERDVLRVIYQRGGRDGAGLFGSLGFRGTRPQIPQRDDTPLADDLLGDLVDGRQHSADPAGRGLVRHRAVRDGKVRFFGEVGTLDLQLKILHPSGRTAMERSINQRLQDVPNF